MSINRIGVIGAGVMGTGLTEMFAQSGMEVLLIEKTTKKLSEAQENIEHNLNRQIERWALTESEKKVILSKINFSLDKTLLANMDLVVESVFEDEETKIQVFKELDQICDENIIIASNTSTISLTEIASYTTKPKRVIGLHFLNPVAKRNVVEIVRALKTSDETFKRAKLFVESIGKVGIEVFESPGYVTTRLIVPFINEAISTIMEGIASAKDVDIAMKLGYDFQYGPLELADRTGLDTLLTIMEHLFKDYGDIKYRPPLLLRKMVRAGHLGTKSGEGFFKYNANGERLD